MLEFQQKKKLKKFLYSPFTLVVLAIVFLLLVRALFGVYTKEKLSVFNLAREQTELDKLSSRESDLNSSISYLKTDEGVDAEIRSKFREVKEGESIAVIIDPNATTSSQIARPPVVVPAPVGFWGKLFHWFGI